MQRSLFSALLLGLALARGANGQGTAFSYQGRLTEGAAAANGQFDIRASLFGAEAAGI